MVPKIFEPLRFDCIKFFSVPDNPFSGEKVLFSVRRTAALVIHITKTCLFKYIENFTTKKKGKFSDKKHLIFFHISAQNIDCGIR